jgi:hypothetical protein
MQSRTWVGLLNRIPPELHESLVFVTSIGTEISAQSVLRMEDEYIVIRGRLAGTTDGGRIFFIPFADINHVLVQKEMKETEIQALFEQATPSAPVVAPIRKGSVQAIADKTVAPNTDNVAGTETPVPGLAKSGIRMPIPSKEAILQRLRARVRSPGGSKHGTP